LARKVIELFTHKGNIVLDPFNGSGTTLVACRDLFRHAIGIDLNKQYCQVARQRLGTTKMDQFLPEHRLNPVHIEIINDDARNLLDYLSPNVIDLVFTSPPYVNILDKERTNKSKHSAKRNNARFGINEQYSDDPRDLGTKEPAEFLMIFKDISTKIFTVLKPGKHYVINIRDVVPFFIQPTLVPALNAIGFELRNVIIWDKRKLIQGMGIFGWPSNFIALNSAYEYIFDFVKSTRQE